MQKNNCIWCGEALTTDNTKKKKRPNKNQTNNVHAECEKNRDWLSRCMEHSEPGKDPHIWTYLHTPQRLKEWEATRTAKQSKQGLPLFEASSTVAFPVDEQLVRTVIQLLAETVQNQRSR